MNALNYILMLGVIAAASAIGLICALGLVVWMAGGKLDQGKDRRHA